MRVKSQRPFVFVNVAMTADGKIAPASGRYEPFGSPRDARLLYELRTQADAIMVGATTLNSFPIKLDAGGAQYQAKRAKAGRARQALRVIVSGGANISPEAEIFRHHFSPIILLTTERAPKKRLAALRALGVEIKVCGKTTVDFAAALVWLRQEKGVQRLLCEGGGELNGALFVSRLVDELYLTICPKIFGGREAPTFAAGVGFAKLAEALPLTLQSKKQVGDELFLVWKAG